MLLNSQVLKHSLNIIWNLKIWFYINKLLIPLITLEVKISISKYEFWHAYGKSMQELEKKKIII